MLKVYDVYSYVSIDGADWRRVGGVGYTITDEDIESETIIDNLSFDVFYEYLSHHALKGVWTDKTFFRNKPIVVVKDSNTWDTVSYRRFNTMSYKYEFKEYKDASLEWMMKHLPADKVIQYLKERGITTCPMNF